MRSDYDYIKGAVDLDLSVSEVGEKMIDAILQSDSFDRTLDVANTVIELLLTCEDEYIICNECASLEEMTRAVNQHRLEEDIPGTISQKIVQEAFDKGYLCLRLVIWDNSQSPVTPPE